MHLWPKSKSGMVVWKYIYGPRGCPDMIWWIISWMVHQKSSIRKGHSSEHYSGIRQLQKIWGLGRRICFCSSQFVKRNIGRVRIFSVLDCTILRGAWISVGIYVFHFSGSHEVSPIIYVLFSCKNLYTEGSWGQVYHCNFANHLLLSSLSPFSYLVIHISYFGMQLMSADNEEFMVVGVLGASGLGRSTILNEIYGFEPSTRG